MGVLANFLRSGLRAMSRYFAGSSMGFSGAGPAFRRWLPPRLTCCRRKPSPLRRLSLQTPPERFDRVTGVESFPGVVLLGGSGVTELRAAHQHLQVGACRGRFSPARDAVLSPIPDKTEVSPYFVGESV